MLLLVLKLTVSYSGTEQNSSTLRAVTPSTSISVLQDMNAQLAKENACLITELSRQEGKMLGSLPIYAGSQEANNQTANVRFCLQPLSCDAAVDKIQLCGLAA